MKCMNVTEWPNYDPNDRWVSSINSVINWRLFTEGIDACKDCNHRMK